jgi:hypothetical protein
MHLAIVNNQTGIVENIAVPPQGAQVFTPPPGRSAIPTEEGNIGDTYVDGQFIKPN